MFNFNISRVYTCQAFVYTIFITMCSYNNTVIDIEELNKKYDTHIAKTFDEPTFDDISQYQDMIIKIADPESKTPIGDMKRQYKFNGKNSFLFKLFQLMKLYSTHTFTDQQEATLRSRLQIKKGKSHSGIISITVFTSGNPEYTDLQTGERKTQQFSCHWNCAYCPNEPGQPRSYLKGEPGVLRANRNAFKCIDQMHDRMNALFSMGHTLDKLEVLVLGGTIASYPHEYVEEFVRDIYYSANVFGISEKRPPSTLQDEKRINKTAPCKVIGLTLETRPDTITADDIKRFRYYGCTRVQLGIQHIDDTILKTIRRQCTTQQTIQAIRLLKDCGYKIDGHWMPNLPGATPQIDDWMLSDQLLGVNDVKYETCANGTIIERWDVRRPDIQVDQWKVYPCTLVPFTDIWKWYHEGTYVPYSQEQLQDVLLKMKSLVFPWIRLNRIIRDIPSDYVPNADYKSDMRNELATLLQNDGLYCRCIRCREVKTHNIHDAQVKTVIRVYNASEGTEYFISKESIDPVQPKAPHIILGFVRLRITEHAATHVFPELEGCALIRELHVYGMLQATSTTQKSMNSTMHNATQHKGIGRELMCEAERIAKEHRKHKMAVIAGEGTRGYYEKLGYYEHDGAGSFMMKDIL